MTILDPSLTTDRRADLGEPDLDAAGGELRLRGRVRRRAGRHPRADVVLRRARPPTWPARAPFRTVQIGRESVIVSRNRRGEIRAFFNICRHRGVRLCAEPEGQVKRAFQCMYHAWTYDLDGKLIAAPNLTKMPDIDRETYGLVQPHVREYLGYVWVCLADEPPSFDDEVIGAVRDRLGDEHLIDGYDVAGLALGRRIVYDVAANWKLIVENFMECYHCATIHPELTEVLPEFADGLAAQYFVGHGAEFGDEIQGFTVDGSDGPRPAAGDRRGPGPPLLRDHHPAERVHQPGARPRDHPPDVPAGRRPHGGRVRLALPPVGGRRRGGTWTRRSSCSTGSTSRTSRPASAASRPCPRGSTPTAGCWCPASTTSAPSTTGSSRRGRVRRSRQHGPPRGVLER